MEPSDKSTASPGSRREAHYRQSPRWCNSRDDCSTSQASFSVGASSTRPRPSPIATTPSALKPRISSPLKKLSNKQHQQATFAAAVSPRPNKKSSPSQNILKRGQSALIMAPLLGAGAASPPSKTKSRTSSFRSSLRAYAGASSRKKLLPSLSLSGSTSPSSSSGSSPTSVTAGGKTKKRRSISRAVQAPFKAVAKASSKVKRRGRKSSASQASSFDFDGEDAPPSPYKRFSSQDSPGTSESDLDASRSTTPPAEAQDDLLCSAPGIIESGTGLTPLTFDDGDVETNHFRTVPSRRARPQSPLEKLLDKTTNLCCGEYPHFDQSQQQGQEFSLHRALSPANSLMDNIDEIDEEYECVAIVQEEESPMSDEFQAMMQPPLLEPLPPAMPALEGGDDCSMGEISIPSMSLDLSLETPTAAVPQDADNADKGADSALAWGALSMLLGSPAPQSVQVKKQKRASTNLWLDDGADDMPLLSDDDAVSLLDDDVSTTQESSAAVSQEDENRIKFNEALEKAMVGRKKRSEKGTTPKAFYESYQKTMVELSPKEKEEDDDSSLPSIGDGSVADEIATPEMGEGLPDAPNADEGANSALAWGALGMLLGSPAPKLVSAKPKKRNPVNLWQDDEASGEDHDDIISLPHDDDDDCSVNSWHSIPSLCPGNEEACSPPSVLPTMHSDESEDCAFLPTRVETTSDKDAADSVLAWTALSAILGSPAPSLVAKKSVKRQSVNLWDDGDEADLLPEIDELDCVVFEDDAESLGIPSIAEDEIDLNELSGADEEQIALTEMEQAEGKKESADSVLAWSALGMFLGAPAPKSVTKKRVTRETKNLWNDGEADGDDALDTIPSIDHDDDEIPSPLSEMPSFATQWAIGNAPDDIPSISRMPSLAGTTDDDSEGSSSPRNSTGSLLSSDDLNASFKRVSSTKDLADSVLAWGALAAFMGSPAPKVALPKKKKEVKDLWGEESDAADFDLIQDNRSSELCLPYRQ